MLAFACGRHVCVCVCVHERALHERLVCVRAVCVFSRACLRVDVSCACVVVACARSRACMCNRRVCEFTSVRVQPSCACAVTSLVRVQPSCVRVHERARAAVVCARSRAGDISCACACCHERYGPSVHFRPLN